MNLDVDLLPDAVMILDGERRITASNTAALRLTGYSRGSLVGALAEDVLDPRGMNGRRLWDGDWHPSAHLRSVTRVPEHEVRLRGADGAELRVSVTGHYHRRSDGQVDGAILVLRDCGRRAHLAATGIEVVSTVSHELRAPLTSVKGYTSLLLNRWERLGDTEKQAMLEQVHNDADRVTRLVTELLDISRLDSGRLILRRQMVDLPALVAVVLEKVRMVEPELEADVDFRGLVPEVYADPDKIEQVLTNLVENAAKYADPKGMLVVGETDGSQLSVSVIDKGDGIPEVDLSRIFKKFFRRAETRPSGSGLGLWISRGLVEAHGGKLVAESVVGRGSVFRFTIPVITADQVGRG